jgi:acetyl esterase
MRWYWRQYLGDAIDQPPSYAAHVEAHLLELPPTFIGAAACDPLIDENMDMAGRFRAAGVATELRVWAGMIHGCVGMARDLNQADHQLAEIAIWLAGRLA